MLLSEWQGIPDCEVNSFEVDVVVDNDDAVIELPRGVQDLLEFPLIVRRCHVDGRVVNTVIYSRTVASERASVSGY